MLQWRHNKTMLVPQSAEAILHAAGIDAGSEVEMDGSEGGADAAMREPEGDSQIDESMPGAHSRRHRGCC